jgi:hypothetical protein
VLSAEGVYCLTQDLHYSGTSGQAINITANSVTLDLNGHAVRSNSAANVQSVGVNVAGQKYFTIIDGTIAGFSRGVAVVDDGSTHSQGGLIANLKIQRSFLYGMLIACDGCVVRDNMVTDTNLPASFVGYGAVGIAVEGTGAQVRGNRVFNTYSTMSQGQQAYGFAVGASNSLILDNYTANEQLGSSPVTGFIISGVYDLLEKNQAQGFTTCYWLQGAGMKYRDNLSGGCTDAFDGGASGSGYDLGGNH